MNVREIMIAHLKAGGFDGLAGDDCGCGLDDLMPCEGYSMGDCKPAKRINCKDDPLKLYKFNRGAKPDILRTYLKLHEGKIGAHWLWIVVQRVANGESADSVLAEYGYTDSNA